MLKRLLTLILAVFIAASAVITASAEEVPALDVNEVFIERNGFAPQKLDHKGESLRTEVTPGSIIYFSIKNAKRAEDLNGYRAVLEWSKGEDYTTYIRIEYREMFDYDGVTSLGYRYVIAMGIAGLSDDVARTLRGSIKLAKRTNQRTDEISFTISVSKGAPIGKATEIRCNTPDITINFETLEDTVIIYFDNFCRFEVRTEGQEYLNGGCLSKVPTDIFERHRYAELRAMTWTKKPIFDHIGTLYIDAYKNEYLYELLGGKLTEADAYYDEEYGAFVVKTRRLEGFVVSDRELDLEAEQVAEPIPPTFIA